MSNNSLRSRPGGQPKQKPQQNYANQTSQQSARVSPPNLQSAPRQPPQATNAGRKHYISWVQSWKLGAFLEVSTPQKQTSVKGLKVELSPDNTRYSFWKLPSGSNTQPQSMNFEIEIAAVKWIESGNPTAWTVMIKDDVIDIGFKEKAAADVFVEEFKRLAGLEARQEVDKRKLTIWYK